MFSQSCGTLRALGFSMINDARSFYTVENIFQGSTLKSMPENVLEKLSTDYLPFRLYAEHKRGATSAQLAAAFDLPRAWVEERVEAARLCIEKQIRVELVN